MTSSGVFVSLKHEYIFTVTKLSKAHYSPKILIMHISATVKTKNMRKASANNLRLTTHKNICAAVLLHTSQTLFSFIVLILGRHPDIIFVPSYFVTPPPYLSLIICWNFLVFCFGSGNISFSKTNATNEDNYYHVTDK